MLYTSLILSALLLLLVNCAVWKGKFLLGTVIASALGFSLCPMMMMAMLPAVLLQSLLLVVVALVSCVLEKPRRAFLPLSCCATLAAYAVVGWSVYREQTKQREQFPYVSMEERLPARKVEPAAPALPLAAATQLQQLEELVESGDPHHPRSRWQSARIEYLEQLHEHTVQAFVNEEGFGSTRMSRMSRWMLKEGLRDGPPLPQPTPRSTSLWSAGTLLVPLRGGEAEPDHDLLGMHFSGVRDFVHPAGFGFFKDRRHVAGFQPHQFSEQPTTVQRWALKTLDLVGLVMHDEPVAYVSANLPRMDELRKAPTRPLDAFEAAGLKALRGGEDLFVRDLPDGQRRLLGSIRSGKQCLSCHEGQRGELLGAFSYTLAPGPR